MLVLLVAMPHDRVLASLGIVAPAFHVLVGRRTASNSRVSSCLVRAAMLPPMISGSRSRSSSRLSLRTYLAAPPKPCPRVILAITRADRPRSSCPGPRHERCRAAGPRHRWPSAPRPSQASAVPRSGREPSGSGGRPPARARGRSAGSPRGWDGRPTVWQGTGEDHLAHVHREAQAHLPGHTQELVAFPRREAHWDHGGPAWTGVPSMTGDAAGHADGGGSSNRMSNVSPRLMRPA